MTDYERRLLRAMTRLAEARRMVESAASDLFVGVPEWERLGNVAERDSRSLRWLCRQVEGLLRRKASGGGG